MHYFFLKENLAQKSSKVYNAPNPNVKFSLRLSKSSYHLLAVQPCVKIQFVLLDFEMLEKAAGSHRSVNVVEKELYSDRK